MLALPVGPANADGEAAWISGTVYLDLNADGRRNPDEPALTDAWHAKYGSLKIASAANATQLIKIGSDGGYRAQVALPNAVRFELESPFGDLRWPLNGPSQAFEVRADGDRIDVGVLVPATPRDQRFFEQTGYRVDSERIWAYYQLRGGEAVFGPPISGAFLAYWGQDCCVVQLFERGAIQAGAGTVGLLNLLDPPLMSVTSIKAGVYPAPDEVVRGAATQEETSLREVVPDDWNGLPVGFQRTYFAAADAAGPAGFGLELWGYPTSRPAADPSNPDVVYQRFQRGVMRYDASCGCVERVQVGVLFKALLTDQPVPADVVGQWTDPTFVARLRPARLHSPDPITVSEASALLAMEPR
jgi:hypothetical protein